METFSKCPNAAILLNNKLVFLNQFYKEKGKNFYKDTLFLPSIILAYLCDLFDGALKKFQTLTTKKENNDLFDEEVYEEYEMLCSKIFRFQISENIVEAFEAIQSTTEETYSFEEIEGIIEYLNEELVDLGFEQMEFCNPSR